MERLRSWAVDSNPLFRDALVPLANQAKADMDAGSVAAGDSGGDSWEEYPTEMYAELFAFMSLISQDVAMRDDYASRARSLLMRVMDEAAKGPADGQPFRDPGFAASDSDRSRWWGEGFALTVDWIYPYLSAADKATIHKVFLRWADDIVREGYHHPEPIGVLNDPVLVSDPAIRRWAGNNYFTAHMRNLGLMAMALDDADDPNHELGDALNTAIGAHLYMVNDLFHNDSRGGLGPEGFEYSPQTIAYVAQFLLALHTAGRDDPALFGPQVALMQDPFWDDFIAAYVHSLSPAPVMDPDQGPMYQPAWYGDGQNYAAGDFIAALGPLALYDEAVGNTTRLAAIRWIQTNMAPGGADGLVERARGANVFSAAILYFMLFDPTAPPPADPRPALPLTFYAPGIGRLFARTSWNADASWFTYSLGWNTIDHQHGDGNTFEFYRQGEWLTKERTGYDLSSSDYHNTLALQNSPPKHNDPGDYRHDLGQRGSQWLYTPSGDGHILATSFGQGFVYALGNATDLYNSEYEGSTDIVHASRSILWLPPDLIVVYDRAASQTDGRFKRFWLNLPADASVSGRLTTMTTAKQQFFITTLLPTNAAISVAPAEPLEDFVAQNEPMQFRLRVEAPGSPQSVRFLHVLEGADAGASPTAVALVESLEGTPFAGVQVGATVVLFPVDLDAGFAQITYTVPAGVSAHVITGLTPNGDYNVVTQTTGGNVQVTITSGTGAKADGGGVLVVGTLR
ncbi:MAG: hypothetical protein C4311_08805 [Chloroflexota bacterium]